jgi:hypothetical protein
MQEVVQVKPLGLRDLMVVRNGNGNAWLHLTFQFTSCSLAEDAICVLMSKPDKAWKQ